MKILSCCPHGYYSQLRGDSYEYMSFVEVPRRMGHTVHHLDHILLAFWEKDHFNDLFLTLAKKGEYDLLLVMTYGDEFYPEALDAAKRATLTVAWNCDDDWRWSEYSSRWARHFAFMVTTYRHIYEENKADHPNLLLSQWGCTGLNEGVNTPKDIPVSFVGSVYGDRYPQLRRLQKRVGLQAFGRGAPKPWSWHRTPRRWIARLARIPWNASIDEIPTQAAVKAIWNRSRISFTPLEGRNNRPQIKARIFDMGLSGTVMTCEASSALHVFYEPNKEYVEYSSLYECEDKIRFYLSNESQRKIIASAYEKRTRRDHLWHHRYVSLFNSLGFKNTACLHKLGKL